VATVLLGFVALVRAPNAVVIAGMLCSRRHGVRPHPHRRPPPCARPRQAPRDRRAPPHLIPAPRPGTINPAAIRNGPLAQRLEQGTHNPTAHIRERPNPFRVHITKPANLRGLASYLPLHDQVHLAEVVYVVPETAVERPTERPTESGVPQAISMAKVARYPPEGHRYDPASAR
jgi:hypothetical protein